MKDSPGGSGANEMPLREYRATMAEEILHHSGPVWSFDLKISTIVALFPLITHLMTPL